MLPRTRAVLATAVVLLVAGSSVNAIAAPATGRTARKAVTALPAIDAAIVAGINAARAQHGLGRLRLSRSLRAAASFHSNDMARHDFFSHDSYDGTSPWTRLVRFYRSAGQLRLGETLLWYQGSVDAATAVRDWLESPEHRVILLGAGFREVGVAAVHTTSAAGWITLVTADFGARTR